MILGKKTVAVLGAALLAASLVGCGSDSGKDTNGEKKPTKTEPFKGMSADEIAKESVAALHALESVRIAGTAPSDGEIVEMDLALDSTGNCEGTVGLGGGTAEVIAADGQQYLRGDEGFWKSTVGEKDAGAVMSLLGDKWAKVPAGTEGVSSFCELDKFLSGFDEDEIKGSKISKGQLTEIDGVAVLELTSVERDGTYKLWVATEGEPYIVRVKGDSAEKGTLTFSEFNEPVDPDVPDADEIADLSGAS